ncbi:MAG TPA: two-component system sensor histidine kinase RppB [Allocoleopsis sp.]
MQSKPFYLTRRRLAAWYTLVMTVILLLCGAAIYRLILHARWLHLSKEMQILATEIEHHIEPALQQPGQFAPIAASLIPGLCLSGQPCSIATPALPMGFQAELEALRQLEKKDYCVRFFDIARRPIASIQLPQQNPACQDDKFWQTFHDRQGHYYHHIHFPLKTQSGLEWGNITIARSLNDLDLYLVWFEVALGVLIVLAVGLVGGSSWWLAGLAMRPVQQSYQQVQQSYQQMQQFTADAAHELRTPLAALRAIVQVALRSNELSPQEVQETLTTINRQSQRLSKLVQDLMTLCQIDQQSQPAPFSLCYLDLLIKELVDEFTALAMAEDISLSVDLQNFAPVYTSGNAEQLYRAIANLLSNAIQYTPAGGSITLALIQDQTHAMIQVKDTGIGIAADEHARIFDRFYRVDRERSRHRGGSGLGLAITQAIVHAHRGTLDVKSEIGQGSTFTLRLPLAQAPNHSALKNA